MRDTSLLSRMRCSRSDGTSIALAEAAPDTMWLAPRLSPSVSNQSNSPSAGPGRRPTTSRTWLVPEAASSKASRARVTRMRLDRNELAAGADMPRQRQRIGTDIGADIDEDPARGHARARKVQLLDVAGGI